MASKGLMFLDSKSSILHEQIFPRILEGKREPCEITFSDFDGVAFKISCDAETPNIVNVNVAMKNIPLLKKMGAQEVIDRIYPGNEIAPSEGYTFALQFNCDSLAEPEKFLAAVSELKRNISGGPLDRAFSALLSKSSDSLPMMIVEYRANEAMFVCPQASKVVVIFQINFDDQTDQAIAKVFLQEFVETQRSVRNAPPVSYSKEPPGELTGAAFSFKLDCAGYISFSVEDRHVAGNGKEKAITLFTGFRNYLHYHIKCSKTYLHMRMRKKVAGWLQILKRAVPEIETEKKSMSGKTFSRK